MCVDRKEGTWSWLRLRQPKFSSLKSPEVSLLWELSATSPQGPVYAIERVSLTILLTPNNGKRIRTDLTKTWTIHELKLVFPFMPVKEAMLEYIIANAPPNLLSKERLFALSNDYS